MRRCRLRIRTFGQADNGYTMIRRLTTLGVAAAFMLSARLNAQDRVTYLKPLTGGNATRIPAEPDLAGAWRGKVTFPSGMFSLEGLEYMYVFNAGGTMTESSNYDGVPPVTPAYGIWRKTGPLTYEAKYQWFQTKTVKSSA